MLAAIRAAELGASVLVVEKMERAGRKLLITGKGRCNITNDSSMSEYFKQIHPNGKFLKHAFSVFFNTHILELLQSQGMEYELERGGRYFPVSDKAGDVVTALLRRLAELKVDMEYHCRVEEIQVKENAVAGVLVTKNGVKAAYTAKCIIIATGGNSYPATGSNGDGYRLAKSLGHSVVPVRPALVPVETVGNMAEKLQGLSLKNVNAIVWVNGKKVGEEFGEMLFTHFGLSGPVILTLSRIIVDACMHRDKVEVSIDLKPALDDQQLDARLLRDLNEHGKKQVENLVKLLLPGKLTDVFIDLVGIDRLKPGNQVNAAERKRMRVLLKDFRFKISGYRSFKEAIITAGGVELSEIDSKTMESKRIKNLYFAGEVMDLDANTGGFNLQIAWSTGWLAGQSASNSIKNSHAVDQE